MSPTRRQQGPPSTGQTAAPSDAASIVQPCTFSRLAAMTIPAQFPAALGENYRSDTVGAFGAALGIDVRQIIELQREIFSDLSTEPGGISWWPTSLDVERRVRISDYLFRVTASITINLTEAQLHLIELRHWEEHDARRFANAVQIVNGVPQLKLPRSERGADDLPPAMANLHQAGVARAIGSALDCLAGTLVGVLGLPIPIVKTGYRDAMTEISKMAAATADSEPIRAARRLLAIVDASGPRGWIDWLLHYRNTLVHRARSMSINELQPTAKLYGANGEPLVRVRPIELLAANPQWTDVEAFAAGRSAAAHFVTPTLTEPADLTLSETVRAAVQMTAAMAAEALRVWRWRRHHPTDVVQPSRQWPKIDRQEAIGFAGFEPGRQPFDPSFMVTNPELAQRMQAARLFDHQQAP